ncbi:MAG: SDR family oxidoreductase [Candidatus Woesearchaeota archaeon]
MQKIIITGGSSGLGLEICKQLKGEIHVLDIINPKEKIDGATYHKTNIYSEKTISILEKIGEVDLVINNAGIMNRKSLSEIKLEEFDEINDVNIKGSYLVSRYSKLKNKGQLIFINSRHGLRAKDTSYSFTKNALKMIAKSFSKKCDVKEAYLGPFEGGASKVGYTKKEYEKREKESVQKIAKLVIKLIKSNHKKLIYKEKIKGYVFK